MSHELREGTPDRAPTLVKSIVEKMRDLPTASSPAFVVGPSTSKRMAPFSSVFAAVSSAVPAFGRHSAGNETSCSKSDIPAFSRPVAGNSVPLSKSDVPAFDGPVAGNSVLYPKSVIPAFDGPVAGNSVPYSKSAIPALNKHSAGNSVPYSESKSDYLAPVGHASVVDPSPLEGGPDVVDRICRLQNFEEMTFKAELSQDAVVSPV